MKFGLTNEHYQFIKNSLEKTLGKDEQVFCFGSRARGDYQKFSDLDLMIESNDDLKIKIFQLNDIFEESRLPIKVDLVQLKDFAESYKINYFKDKKIF
jgi:predicted nucleotidyltransferase